MQLKWAALELELEWVATGVDGVGVELKLDYSFAFNDALKASSAGFLGLVWIGFGLELKWVGVDWDGCGTEVNWNWGGLK